MPTHQELLELKEAVLNFTNSDSFYIGLARYAAGLRHLAEEELSNPEYLINFENKNFEMDIRPGDDINNLISIRFDNCTFIKAFEFHRFRDIRAFNCDFQDVFLKPYSIHSGGIYGGTIGRLNAVGITSGGGLEIIDVVVSELAIKQSMEWIFFSRVTFLKIYTKVVRDRKITLKDVTFRYCTFKCDPDFLEANLLKTVEFYNCDFLVNSSVHFRDLKHKMSDNRHDLAAALFSGLELRCSHDYMTSPPERFFSSCYRWLSDYGLDPYRPIFYLVGLFALAISSFLLEIYLLGEFAIKKGGFLSGIFFQALYLASVSLLGPLRVFGAFDLLEIKTALPQFMIWFFTVFSSLFWFFLILAVRKRFKVD